MVGLLGLLHDWGTIQICLDQAPGLFLRSDMLARCGTLPTLEGREKIDSGINSPRDKARPSKPRGLEMGGWNPPYEWFTMPDSFSLAGWDLPVMGQQQTKHIVLKIYGFSNVTS